MFPMPRKGPVPNTTEQEKHRFELLRRAYTEARYERGYDIEKEELEYLSKRVSKLREVTEALCRKRIERYEKEAALFGKGGV